MWLWALLGAAALAWRLKMMAFQGVVFPIERPRVTLRFGATTPPYAPGNPHRGVDLAPYPGSSGRPVVAAVGGDVLEVGESSGFGRYVVVRSRLPFTVWATDLAGVVRTLPPRTPFYLIYAHLDEVSARVGANVRTGEVLGTIGATGYADGPHLHLEMRVGDYAARDVVDPLDMLIATVVGLKGELVYA